MSYSWRNSHWSPFLQSPLSQCLHTTVFSPLVCLNGQSAPRLHMFLVKYSQTAAPDSVKQESKNRKHNKQEASFKSVMQYYWKYDIQSTRSCVPFHSYCKYKWWVEFLFWPFCAACCIITMKSFTTKPSNQTMCFNLELQPNKDVPSLERIWWTFFWNRTAHAVWSLSLSFALDM